MAGGIVILVPQAHGSTAVFTTNDPGIIRELKKIGKPTLAGPTPTTLADCVRRALAEARRLP